MERFPHLKFSENLIGRARFKGGQNKNQKTEDNKKNRDVHSRGLLDNTNKLKSDWSNYLSERENLNLAPLKEQVKPIFLQINPDLLNDLKFDLNFLNIEIISEEDEGFIIGASLDNLRTLENKILEFASKKHGSEKVADLWQIIDGNREDWKPQHILSPELLNKWHNLYDNENYQIEVSIAFDKPIGKEPDPTKKGGEKRLKKYYERLSERDKLYDEREEDFINFINFYNAEINSSIINLGDSFGCQITINGKGLKDLVINYPYVFEVNETEKISGLTSDESETSDFDLDIEPPDDNSPEIGIIDSGIMENNKFLYKAILPKNSKSYLKSDSSVSDKVKGGGHGTKVASALLFSKGISGITSPYKLPCFVRNLRVLNDQNILEHKFPAELMQKIVEENSDIRVFNLSINSQSPFRKKHMSTWAAAIDKLIHENNILFINSSGNISKQEIREYILSYQEYPHYLSLPNCKLANPAQSSFSIAVGSVNHLTLENDDWSSIGNENEISPYSRIGSGIWEHIKPDLVEYGGGMQISKNGINSISHKDTSIELIRSTYHGGNAFSNESVGTSFAAPKVSYIVAELLKLYKNENINLIRALLVQGARLPNQFFENPTKESIQHFGYGIPSLKRVTENTEHRITFYNTNTISAERGQIYTLKIPKELRGQGDEYQILIEVTLAYTAKNRRTRQKTKSYLSTWLEWKSSNLEDSYISFRDRILSELDGEKIEENTFDSGSVIQWKIRERDNWGVVEGISRNKSSLQKDWAILNSYELPEELHFAITAHKGWDINKEEIPYALTVSIEILGNNIPIYDSIRIENAIEIPIRT